MSAGGEPFDERLFPGLLAPFRSKLVWAGEALPPAGVDRAALLEHLTCFQRSVHGGWQPACSLWAQIYFNTLLIPAVCLLRREAAAWSAGTAITGSFCPVSGVPLGFALCGPNPARPACLAGSGWLDLLDLLDRHVDALIADLAVIGRLSRRMLRESADRAVGWTVRQIALDDPAGASALAGLVEVRPTGCLAALRCSGGPEPTRRTCCLRDRLPGYQSCGALCPRGPTHAAHPHAS